METVVLTVHLILAFLLVGIVLLQRSEGGGLMSQGGAMSARSAATALSKVTWVIAAMFIMTSIALTFIAAEKAGVGSIADQISAEPAAETGTDSGLSGDLTAPLTTDEPATPPPAQPAAPSN
jgi:preprotein translocase subunit SecG